MKSYETIIENIIKRLLTGSIRLHCDTVDKLGFNFDENGALSFPKERQRAKDLISYLQQTNIQTVAADIFWSLPATGESEKHQYMLVQPDLTNTKASVLLLKDHGLIPDAVTKLMPNLTIRPDSPVMDRMWPVIPLLSYIPIITDISPSDEDELCRDYPDRLSVRTIHSTGDLRYSGYHAESDRVVSFYVHTVDITKPWTIVSNTNSIEIAMEIPLYEEVTPAIQFYREIQKGETP